MTYAYFQIAINHKQDCARWAELIAKEKIFVGQAYSRVNEFHEMRLAFLKNAFKESYGFMLSNAKHCSAFERAFLS